MKCIYLHLAGLLISPTWAKVKKEQVNRQVNTLKNIKRNVIACHGLKNVYIQNKILAILFN